VTYIASVGLLHCCVVSDSVVAISTSSFCCLCAEPHPQPHPHPHPHPLALAACHCQWRGSVSSAATMNSLSSAHWMTRANYQPSSLIAHGGATAAPPAKSKRHQRQLSFQRAQSMPVNAQPLHQRTPSLSASSSPLQQQQTLHSHRQHEGQPTSSEGVMKSIAEEKESDSSPPPPPPEGEDSDAPPPPPSETDTDPAIIAAITARSNATTSRTHAADGSVPPPPPDSSYASLALQKELDTSYRPFGHLTLGGPCYPHNGVHPRNLLLERIRQLEQKQVEVMEQLVESKEEVRKSKEEWSKMRAERDEALEKAEAATAAAEAAKKAAEAAAVNAKSSSSASSSSPSSSSPPPPAAAPRLSFTDIVAAVRPTAAAPAPAPGASGAPSTVLTNATIRSLNNQMKSLKAEMESIREERDWYEKRYKDAKFTQEELEEEVRKLDKQLEQERMNNKGSVNNGGHRGSLSVHRGSLILSPSSSGSGEVDRLRAQLSTLHSEKQSLQSSHESLVASLNEELGSLKEELTTIRNERDEVIAELEKTLEMHAILLAEREEERIRQRQQGRDHGAQR